MMPVAMALRYKIQSAERKLNSTPPGVSTSLFTKWISLAIKHSKWTIASGQNGLIAMG